MDVDQTSNSKKNYKFSKPVFDNFYILYNKNTNLLIFWNKYQIFLYEHLNLENPAKAIIPDYQIQCLILSNNYLVSLDCNGNVHTTSMKFKKVSQQCCKSPFQPRDSCIRAITQLSTDYALSLKMEDDLTFLCVHKINQDFNLEKKMVLLNKEPLPVNNQQGNFMLTCHSVKEVYLADVQKIFNSEEILNSDYSIVLISFDRKAVYACLLNPNSQYEEVSLVKLYSSPSEICNIELTDVSNLQIFIGLTIGTIIKLSLTETLKKPDVIHLNIALSKFLKFNNNLFYTDSQTMWKAENISTENIKFRQCYITNLKDFIITENHIICTTYSKFIYKFSIENNDTYLKIESHNEYCPAEEILTNSEYLQRILEDIEINEQLVKRLGKEENHLTALALSNRCKLMDDVFQSKIVVYDNYEDVLKETTDLVLTENISNYFEKDLFCFLIEIKVVAIQHKLSKVLENIFENSRLHITLSSDQKILKSESIKIYNPFNNSTFLIPWHDKDMKLNKIIINIKIVTDIPGIFNEKENTWTILYNKNINLNAEHFIKVETKTNTTVKSTKLPTESISKMILKNVNHEYGHIFTIADITECKIMSKQKSYYVKLPKNYEEILKHSDYCNKHLNTNKSKFLVQQYTSNEFQKSKSNILLQIGISKVKIEIINFITNPMLKVTSENYKAALSIRNFFANLLYNVKSCENKTELISNSFYTTVENLQKDVKNCLSSSDDEIVPLLDQFEKNVIGGMPL